MPKNKTHSGTKKRVRVADRLGQAHARAGGRSPPAGAQVLHPQAPPRQRHRCRQGRHQAHEEAARPLIAHAGARLPRP